MVQKIRVKVDPDGTFGFDQLDAMLGGDPTFARRFESAFTKANRQIGTKFVRDARVQITRTKPFAANAPATIAAKKSTTPLVDHGDLVGSLNYDVKGPDLVRMGINSPRLASGRYLYEVLHNGATVRRGAGVWILPARPFLSTVWENPKFLEFIEDRFKRALASLFTAKK